MKTINFYSYFHFILFWCSVGICGEDNGIGRQKSQNALEQNSTKLEPEKRVEIYFVNIGVSYPYALDSSDVKQSSKRMLVIKKPDQDQCYTEWKGLPEKKFSVSDLHHSDMRVVFIDGVNEYAFSQGGKNGIVNGQTVVYGEEVQRWFMKHLAQLIKF